MQRYVTLILLLLLLAVTPAIAENTTKVPAPIIAVIDVQRILQESMAAQSAQKQLEGQRGKFQTDTEGEENDLRKSEQELSKSREKLTADAYAQKEQQLRERFLSVERQVQARRKALDQAFTESMNLVRTNLLQIVEIMSREKGVNLVLVKQQALWADKNMDITDEVLTRLNKQLPEVSVNITPKNPNNPAPNY